MTNDLKKTVLGWTNDQPWPAPSPQGQPQGGDPNDPNQGYQQPYSQQPYSQQPYSQQPYQQPYPQQPYPQGPPQQYQQPYPQPPYPEQPYPQQPQPYAQQPYPQQPYPTSDQPPQPFAPVYGQDLQAFAPPHGLQPHAPQYPQHAPAYGQAAQVQGYPQHQPQAGYDAAAAQHHAASYLKPRAADASDGTKRPRQIASADATVGVSQRVRFIRLTYLHLLGAILAFAGLLYLLMTNDMLIEKVSIPLVKFALGGRWNWGVVLAAFMAVSWVADYWASHASSRGIQYAGLGFYIIAEALIFVPLLAIVEWKTQALLARGGHEPHIIRDSAFVTMGIFAALTASVFLSKKDFSFLRSGLVMASGAALMLIVLSLAFGFNLGLVFSVAMVLLAAAYILYQTSQVLAHYDPHQHVAAALALFSSVALMFWYVIRIFMRARE